MRKGRAQGCSPDFHLAAAPGSRRGATVEARRIPLVTENFHPAVDGTTTTLEQVA
jgi:hypothetical protein